MTIDLETLTLNNPTNLWLEIPERATNQNLGAKPSLFYRQSSLDGLSQPFELKSIFTLAKSKNTPQTQKYFLILQALPSIWEATNGTGISFTR